MKNRNGKNKTRRQGKAYSPEVVEFCKDIIADDTMNGIAVAYLNFNGKKLLKKLPADAPRKLRDRLEAMVKSVDVSRPAFNALARIVNKIGCP